MTAERRQDAIIVALVLSIAVHFGVMYYIRTQIMTSIARGKSASERTVPMQVVKTVPMAETEKIAELLDLKAEKDAPEAERIEVKDTSPAAAIPESEKVAPVALAKSVEAPQPQQTVFEAKVSDSPNEKPPAVPVLTINTPLAMMTADAVMPPIDSQPTRALPVPTATAIGALSGPGGDGTGLGVGRISTRIAEKQKVEFKPSETVYEKVDEKVVAEERAAVKELVYQDAAEELSRFVNITLVRETVGEWTYFKALLLPRATLPTVPKDVVVIIDASGSIGSDRMGSIRGAAKRILRSATNSGDRFNFVAFRDRFSYAFRSWQSCTQQSFDQSDKWLNNVAAHGRTDVFSTISSVLTLPRDPKRPLIALVVTDGDANTGVSDNASILKKFTALNDGLISVYMYGVKSSANRELIDVLTRGNRGESFIFEGWRHRAGSGLEPLSERFRDPVLSDLRMVFATDCPAEAYPRHLRNIYRGGTLEITGRVRTGVKDVAFSLRGLNGPKAYEGFFRLPLATAPARSGISADWSAENAIAQKLQ